MRKRIAAWMMFALMAAGGGAAAAAVPQHWSASWGTAQMRASGDSALPPLPQDGVTLRQVVHISSGGPAIRIRFSNAFGERALAIGGASVAIATAPGSAALVNSPASLQFHGKSATVISAGESVWSDPVPISVAEGADLAISLYLPEPPAPETGHPGARATTYALPGRHIADMDLSGASRLSHWYVIADVDVAAPPAAAAIVAIGDSITDGYGVGEDSNHRWPDRLAQRLAARPETRAIGVVNAGIGGNRVLLDGLGPNLVARFDRDVLDRSGVRWAIVLEGVNDLGVLTRDAPASAAAHHAIVADIVAAYRQMVAKAHARDIKVIGGTIMPFVGNDYYHAGAASEADRQAINSAIRAGGIFDAVIDFDQIMRDPQRPDMLAPIYDSGDHLHPSDAGYRHMGDAVPLDLFLPAKGAPRADSRPAIALTFDDIPAHGPLPSGVSRIDVIRSITAALTAANAPAFGFYNGGFGLDDATSDAAASLWRAAGFPLGNHSYSHRNLAEIGAAEFVADVVKNEAPLAAKGQSQADWHWFRYPFLSEGSTPAMRESVRSSLAQRGYRIAAVTMSFNDFNWNAPYAKCAAKGDKTSIETLERSFLTDARAAAVAARAAAKAKLGRDIPYVLLMHVGAFDAHMLPALLDLYSRMGFRFVSMPDAEKDPFYAAAVDPLRNEDSPGLTGAALAGPPALPCS